MYYNLRPDVTKAILAEKRTLDSLTEADFIFVSQQKGVDMRIGIDIASVTYESR